MRVSRTSESVAPYTPVAEEEPAPTPAKGQVASSTFGLLVQSLGRELDKGEALADRAIRGGGAHRSPEELIALQAGIYRYSEAVDLVTKVVDRATQAVKTTLQNQ